MVTTFRSAWLILGAVSLGACAPRDDGTARNPSGERPAAAAEVGPAVASAPAGLSRTVLVAPVDLGPLTTIYGGGRLDYAERIADFISGSVHNLEGQLGEGLPDSGDPLWSHGLPAAAQGKRLVVLTRVLDLHRAISDDPRRQRQEALVELRGIGANGSVVFSKRVSCSTPMGAAPSSIGGVNSAASMAVWQGISLELDSLKEFLDAQTAAIAARSALEGLPLADGSVVQVMIDSRPSNADILVDGVFRGNTPLTLALPRRQLTVRIERQGCQAWERQLTPGADMHLQPALEPLGSATAPATPLVPVPVPDTVTPAPDNLGPTPTLK